jgi:hypothetical protein
MIDRKNTRVGPSPVGLRRGDLNNENFVRVDANSKKKVQAIGAALDIVDRLQKLADQVFVAQAGLLERGIQGGRNAWEQILQSNPAFVLYSAQSQGFLSQLSRALGEVGTLTDEDIRRAKKLVPRTRNVFGLPDTADVATGKIESLKAILQQQYNTALGKDIFDIETPVIDKLIENTPGEENLLEQGTRAVGEAERGISQEAIDAAEKLIKEFKLQRVR